MSIFGLIEEGMELSHIHLAVHMRLHKVLAPLCKYSTGHRCKTFTACAAPHKIDPLSRKIFRFNSQRLILQMSKTTKNKVLHILDLFSVIKLRK